MNLINLISEKKMSLHDLNSLCEFSEVEYFNEQIFIANQNEAKTNLFGGSSRPSQNNTRNFTDVGNHVLFLCHGMNGNFEDMNVFRANISTLRPELLVINILTIEDNTGICLDQLGQMLAKEVEGWLDDMAKGSVVKISFLGFSMGGLIIRSALPYLQEYKSRFFSLITFGSPHLGMGYSQSVLISLGMKFYSSFKNYMSIKQIMLQDHKDPFQAFLFKLSQNQVAI